MTVVKGPFNADDGDAEEEQSEQDNIDGAVPETMMQESLHCDIKNTYFYSLSSR